MELAVLAIILGIAALVGWATSYIEQAWLRIPVTFILAALPGILFCEWFRSARLKRQTRAAQG